MIYATKQRVIWIDVDLRAPKDRGKKPSISKEKDLAMIKLTRAFTQWRLDENIPTAAGGQTGAYGFSAGFTPHYAKRVIAWLKKQGIEVESVWGRKKCSGGVSKY